MKLPLLKTVIALLLLSTSLTGCITSKVKPVTQAVNTALSENSGVKIFLLERDIPADIEQLGVVTISITRRHVLNIDEVVKQQLMKDCQRLGANGAYRVNDGTYFPTIVNYLAFKYK